MKLLLFNTICLFTCFTGPAHASGAATKDSSHTIEKMRTYSSSSSAKDSHEIFRPFLRIYLGGFHAFTETSITLNSETLGRGTTIDPENVFGHKERKFLPRAEVLLNIGKRHEFNFVYWTIRRSRTRMLEKDVQFEDTTFYVNTSTLSKINFSNYSGNYRFSIFAQPHWNAGISIGGKFFDSYSSITANLNGLSYTAEKRIYAPVPLLGLHASVTSGKHFLIRGTAEYFKLNINDWDFRCIDLRGGIEFYPVKYIGIGADYHFFDTTVRKVPSGKLNGEIDLKFNAVSLYIGIRI